MVKGEEDARLSALHVHIQNHDNGVEELAR